MHFTSTLSCYTAAQVELDKGVEDMDT